MAVPTLPHRARGGCGIRSGACGMREQRGRRATTTGASRSSHRPASTAQIAEEIGGDLVDVTSIVSSASQDPHSFEPSAQDQLAVRHADLVIENGGGYDSFIDALLEASGSTAPVLTAVEFSSAVDRRLRDGLRRRTRTSTSTSRASTSTSGTTSQAMGALAHGIQSQLEALSPDDARGLRGEPRRLPGRRSADWRTTLAAVDADHAGAEIFVTEPVPLLAHRGGRAR